MDVAKVLPLAFVMIAGPQIISAFFFATSDSWKRTSAAYVLGAAIAILAVVSAAYLLASGAEGGDSGDSGLNTLDYAVLALLAVAAVHTFRGRKQSEPPRWMGKLQTATPRTTFVLGFLLLGFFPSDLVTSVSVGSFLGDRGDPWWHALPFVALTLLLLTAPALLVAGLGDRAQRFLPRARDWVDANSWIVSEVVIVFFVAIVLSG